MVKLSDNNKNMNVSLTFTGIIGLIIVTLAKQMGVDIDVEAINTTIATVGQFITVAVIYWGRYRQGNVTWYGTRI